MPFDPVVMIDDINALKRALQLAEADGDREHANHLRERITVARRLQRELDAGIKNIGWNFPKEWCQ